MDVMSLAFKISAIEALELCKYNVSIPTFPQNRIIIFLLQQIGNDFYELRISVNKFVHHRVTPRSTITITPLNNTRAVCQ